MQPDVTHPAPSLAGAKLRFARLAAVRACGSDMVVALALLAAVGACSGSSVENVQQETLEGTVHVCSSCHGREGRSVSPTFPRLAGQQKDYLEAQLKAFRDHSRADPHAHTYMWGMTAKLSDAAISELASYYSSQRAAPGSPQNPAQVAAGKKIFTNGAPGKDVPPCIACHGGEAQGNGATPRLAGQHRSYLIEQLEVFQSNQRANPAMHLESTALSAQQIDQVASFLAEQ